MKIKRVPDEWIVIHFKDYPRLSKIDLPRKFSKLPMRLETAIKNRRSRRQFNGKSLTLKELSKLLFYSCGIIYHNKDLNKTRRAYPSAGARYPLEVYLATLRKNDLNPGVYHYNIKNHGLEILLEGDYRKHFNYLYTQGIGKGLSVLLIITSISSRTSVKYPAEWQRFVSLEAGHISQNVYLISEALGLSCCAIGGWDKKTMNELLDIDGKYENIVHMIAIGKRAEPNLRTA